DVCTRHRLSNFDAKPDPTVTGAFVTISISAFPHPSVNPHTPSSRAVRSAWILCIFFVLAGNLFIPYLGIENDEALFAQGLYHPRGELYSLHIGRSHVPIMLMSYVGALKSWIYGPILKAFGISLRTLRQPMLLAGAVSIWLFFLLLRRIAGNRAALIGCAL